ncbi:MAG: hypothetical protein FJW20_01675 [Acidimicrobiia bacterium]|nr:hypothetical protein [Acidimicrobiia bacterium]
MKQDAGRRAALLRLSHAVWLLAAALFWWPPAALAQSAESCAGCHDVAAKLSTSTHAKVVCAKCHPQREEYPHPPTAPKPACGSCHAAQSAQHGVSVHGQKLRQGDASAPDCATCHGAAHEVTRARNIEFHKEVPNTCGMCHTEVLAQFQASVHGAAAMQGVPNAPVCTDCHGEHSILPSSERASTTNPRQIRETCGRCHGDIRLMRRFGLPQDRLTSFDESFHGLAARGGSQTVANCASCHGYHNVLPSSNPKSMTHPDHLAQTCGQCHPGAGRRFALGPIHAPMDNGEAMPIRFVRLFYQVLIPVLIGWMLLHNGGDWLRKLRRIRFSPALPAAAVRPSGAERMLFWERIQHAVLAVSFLVLVWTGFALKYPEQWWAIPLGEARGIIHRIAGAVMIAASVAHLASLLLSRRLREHWMHMLPRRQDLPEAVQGTLHSLGLRRDMPHRSSHSYIEKAEYWAVVWGTALMGLTGIMLWANNLMLEYFPKWTLDLALTLHLYEAILAALAILVWHFYFVIFDPDVYPMDMAWLTGRSARPVNPHSKGESPANEE